MSDGPHDLSRLTLDELRRVHTIVRQYLNSSYDTESIAMDIVIEYCSKGITDPGWIYVRNRCFDVLRQRSREKLMLQSQPPHDSPHPTQNSDDMDQINSLTRTLDPTERKVLIHRFFLDLSVSEISRNLRIPEASVREILTQAIYKMKQEAYE